MFSYTNVISHHSYLADNKANCTYIQGVHWILCFFEDFKIYILGVSECKQWQVKHRRCSRTSQKNHNILKKNTIFNKHPVHMYPYSISASIQILHNWKSNFPSNPRVRMFLCLSFGWLVGLSSFPIWTYVTLPCSNRLFYNYQSYCI